MTVLEGISLGDVALLLKRCPANQQPAVYVARALGISVEDAARFIKKAREEFQGVPS